MKALCRMIFLALIIILATAQGFAVNTTDTKLTANDNNPQWSRAREIMGSKNFFGVAEAVKHFQINPTAQQLATLQEIPFSETLLQQSKDTYILVAVFPLSIIEIRERVAEKHFRSHQDAWYNQQSFATDRGEASWQLIRQTPVENSLSKKQKERQLLISQVNEVPSAQVMVYATIGHYLVSGKRLFENVYVLTSSRIPSGLNGQYVNIGRFDSLGMQINYYWNDDLQFADLGIASAQKSRTLR